MTDTYARLANGKWTAAAFKALKLPQPTPLVRYQQGDALIQGNLIVGAAKGGQLGAAIIASLVDCSASISYPNNTDYFADLHSLFNRSNLNSSPVSLNTQAGKQKLNALIFDASGISSSAELKALQLFFQPVIKQLSHCARVVILARPPTQLKDIQAATAQRAIEGFTRSLAKEIGRNGSTCQLLHVDKGYEALIVAPLRFILSAKSAYISAQVFHVKSGELPAEIHWQQPLQGKIALVTGASRGIGAAIVETLARDGAHVICLDIPALKQDLDNVAQRLNGSALTLDVTDAHAGALIAAHLADLAIDKQAIDIVVHNAGVTKDKTLARMTDSHWDMLMDINITAIERINNYLLAHSLINRHGRIICVSSMSGIAGTSDKPIMPPQKRR